MQTTNYLDHPTEEVLERFVLQRSREEELESVETHILACEPCVARLQALEIEVAATKLALQRLQSERTDRAVAKERISQKSWFSMPTLSMAGALAAIAVGVFALPQLLHRNGVAADVTLSAYRGMESTAVPAGHPLRMHLNAADLAAGPVSVQVVGAAGAEFWKGKSVVQHDSVDVTIPSMSASSAYFLRLYRQASGEGEDELLREFAFQVK